MPQRNWALMEPEAFSCEIEVDAGGLTEVINGKIRADAYPAWKDHGL